MSKLRKTPVRVGRRSVRAGAIFAALAFAFSASAFFSTTVASAGQDSHNATCGLGDNEIDAQSFHERHCFTVETPLDGESFPLGTPVHDTAVVTKTVETTDPCAVEDVACSSTFSRSSSVTFQFFDGSGCNPDQQRGSDENVPIAWPDPQSEVDSGSVVLPAGSYSALATFYGSVSFGQKSFNFYADGECENFVVDPRDPGVSTTIIPSNNVNEGSSVRDTATVSGVSEFTPTGEVSFSFYDGWNCDSFRNSAGSALLDSNGFADGSATQGPLAPGEYSFRASYEGDDNYNAATGSCENLSVNDTTPTVVSPEVVVRPVIIVQPAPQVEVSPAAAVRATGTFTG